MNVKYDVSILRIGGGLSKGPKYTTRREQCGSPASLIVHSWGNSG